MSLTASRQIANSLNCFAGDAGSAKFSDVAMLRCMTASAMKFDSTSRLLQNDHDDRPQSIYIADVDEELGEDSAVAFAFFCTAC